MSVQLDIKEKDVNLYLPEKVRIKRVEEFTDIDKFFEVELLERDSLKHNPGQFLAVSLPGIGEAPISIASPPSDGNTFELCVRALGELTNIFNKLKAGDEFYIRGPFGHGFDDDIIKSMQGKHLLFILGGCGYSPMRSLINLVIKEPQKYKKISILYGCRMVKRRLYVNELGTISNMGGNVELMQIVDKGDEDWEGEVGLITTLIPKVSLDPEDIVAIVVGPPVMYKYVIKKLLNRDVKKEDIYVSLERRMKCSVGKCGHCQIGGFYACQQGPVFRYTDVEDNEEAL